MHWLAMGLLAGQGPRVVLLRMKNAAASRHALGQAGVDHAGVPSGVLVYQRATHDPSHDLHVSVGMGLESSAWRDYVVVVHQQQAVMGVIGLIMAAERERVVRVQPKDLRLRAAVCPPRYRAT